MRPEEKLTGTPFSQTASGQARKGSLRLILLGLQMSFENKAPAIFSLRLQMSFRNRYAG
jgi:hypothetical protein